MTKLLVTLTFLLSTFAISAKAIQWKKINFSIDFPETWREVKDFYGIPVTLFGPSVPGKPRAVIQIIPTDLKPIKLNQDEARRFGEKYAEGRREWLKDQNAEIYEILPGKLEAKGMSSGVSYRLNAKSYIERTFYINCPQRIFHLKIVLNFENKKELAQTESIVRSFACEE